MKRHLCSKRSSIRQTVSEYESGRQVSTVRFFTLINQLKVVLVGEGRILVIQMVGIPICHGGDVLLQGQVSAVASPAQSLDRYLQVFLKVHGVGDVPAVHIEITLGVVGVVYLVHLVHARIGCAELSVAVHVKIAGAAEVVLCACSADGGEVGVTVNIELNLAFSPPAVVLNAPVEVCSHVVAASLDVVRDNVVFLIGQGIYAAELCVEIKRLSGNLLFLAVDLIVKIAYVMADIFDLKAEALEIRHFEIAVEPLCGINAHGKAGKLAELVVVRVAEEIGKGSFNGRVFMAVKVDAQNEPAAHGKHIGDPEMLDGTLPLDVGKSCGLAGLNDKVRINLPALTQFTCGVSGTSVCSHTALAFFACKVFGGNGEGSDVFLCCKIRKHGIPLTYGFCRTDCIF